ncbi:hypothetical protein [Lolliginicoccus suaedae]|uniref:hypothetical protein n=1 Tax=Lolliginicoccus suaedae TaxID=2605429 RepID=UPI001658FB34|nr:hypothetical protein [Lolliginicoccus suaedae]
MACVLLFALVVTAMASVLLWGALGPVPGLVSTPGPSDIRGTVAGQVQLGTGTVE